jgi:hypothetical protein
MLPFIGLFRASAQSHPDLFSAAFITNIEESNFRHTQGQRHFKPHENQKVHGRQFMN